MTSFINPQRKFLPANFEFSAWQDVKIYLDKLLNENIESVTAFESWLKNRSELESFLSENMAWRYIKMTCDTSNNTHKEAFEFFVTEIQPNLANISDKLNKKSFETYKRFPLAGEAYDIMFRGIEKSIALFREENVAIETQIQIKQAEYQSITGAMNIEYEGKELTMPQATSYLQNIDRKVRESIWNKINDRRLLDAEKLDKLFSELVQLRHKIALNAGFKNYRDYMFEAMGRFDYTPQDCFDFHSSVAKTVVPITKKLHDERKNSLSLSQLRPWDLNVDPESMAPLKPFTTAQELLDKTEQCFERLGSDCRDKISQMRAKGHFDLESRKGKAPGGYNYPLEETGMPFIFMNASDTLRDLVTMVHEGGHALHSFAVRHLPINAFRNPPMEVAELASMVMELISMEHWDVYFDQKQDLKRAKLQHLNDVLTTLPWIMTVDKFQHWIYENPDHSIEDRKKAWVKTYREFSDDVLDWNGFEMQMELMWQKQLHIFEVPFYYIEYGIAQLGAISVWKNYKETNQIQTYLDALELGYTQSIRGIYEAAGVKFDFSQAYISSLMDFVSAEIEKLNQA